MIVEMRTYTIKRGHRPAILEALKGPTFDGLCAGTNSACITKCLGEVNSCSDVSCTFCEACDCVGDRFSLCLGTCTSAMAQQ